MSSVTVIILTFNESQHIERCIRSVQRVANRVCVVDSYSSDDTETICRNIGVDFYQNAWVGHAHQFNWALDHCEIATEWVMRIDADEYLEDELVQSIQTFIKQSHDYNAAYLRRKIIFLDQPIKHGFFYPNHILRLWKNGSGRVEERWMDEHVLVNNANVAKLPGDLVDHNLNDIAWWTSKHVRYAELEIMAIVESQYKAHEQNGHLSGQAKIKRFIKNNIYNKLPSGVRGFIYFIYRYFGGLGFLDGRAGFYFHFLQAFWYRTFVDAMLYELTQEAKKNNLSVYELLKTKGKL